MITYTTKTFSQLNTTELYEILRLRTQVFVVEQDCVFQDMDNKDQIAIHCYLSNEKGDILAYARLFNKDQSFKNYASIGRVITNPDFRGQGAGKKLMSYCIKESDRLFNNSPIKIGAQCYLQNFYENFGFKNEGNAYLEDGILHNYMIKE